MFRGVVKDDPAQKRFRLLDAEHFLEALAEMGIEVVHDQMDAPRRGIDLFEQIPDEGHKVGLGAAVGHQDRSPPALGFHCHEQIAGAGAHILAQIIH